MFQIQLHPHWHSMRYIVILTTVSTQKKKKKRICCLFKELSSIWPRYPIKSIVQKYLILQKMFYNLGLKKYYRFWTGWHRVCLRLFGFVELISYSWMKVLLINIFIKQKICYYQGLRRMFNVLVRMIQSLLAIIWLCRSCKKYLEECTARNYFN